MSQAINLEAFGSDPAPAQVPPVLDDSCIERPGVLLSRQRTRPNPAPRKPNVQAPAMLLEDVEDLANSLGVQPTHNQDGTSTYKPDAFVRAVRLVHDKLVEVKNDLSQQARELNDREVQVQARERAVKEREERVEGLEALGTLLAFQRPASTSTPPMPSVEPRANVRRQRRWFTYLRG